MEDNISARAVNYVKDHENEMAKMLCAFWKFTDCCGNEEMEREVFEEYKECFGVGVDYVRYALTLREICSAGEACGLLQNRLDVVASDENRYLHTLLYGVLREWWMSCSRRKVVRCFLSYVPMDYMERIWRKAGAELNNISEEEVKPEMLWKYPRREDIEKREDDLLCSLLESEENSSREDSGKINESIEALKNCLDDLNLPESELVQAFREVFEALTEEDIKMVEARLKKSELAWCILYAQKEERERLLEVIDDEERQKCCLLEGIRIGYGGGYARDGIEETMPLAFFIKCNAVKNTENSLKDD